MVSCQSEMGSPNSGWSGWNGISLTGSGQSGRAPGRGAVAGVPATGVVVAPAHTFSDSVQAGAGHRPLTLSRLPTATPDAAPPVPAGPTGAAGAGSFEGSAAALAETAPRTATPGTTPTKSV